MEDLGKVQELLVTTADDLIAEDINSALRKVHEAMLLLGNILESLKD